MESRIFLIFLLLTTCLFIPSNTQFLSLQNDEAFTSIVISQEGLDFLKNLLITKAISSIIPLKLPKIEKTVKVPFLGHVNMELSNITINEIQVLSSHITPGDTGVAIIASGTTCNLSLDWFYEYSGGWLVPVEISDSGSASVQVEGMQVGLTVSLENLNGTLKLSPLQCGCYVEDISINLDGGASWLYQGMVNAFDDQIRSTVESSITKELGQAVLKLDSFLQSLPKEIPVDDNAALNVTFVNNPSLTSSSIGLDINGLFTARKKMLANHSNHIALQPSVECMNPSKMIGISLDEAVFASASALYYDAKFLQWIVDKDKVPQQSLLNTAEWRFIIPQLYKKYRNDDMNLNITLSSPPVIKITEHGVDAIVYADLIIDVLEADQVIPVACISLEIHGSGAVQISGNNLGGSIKVDDFTMSLKWSDIGTLRLYLVQPVMWTLMRTVFLPYVNARLGHGFPLPIIHGFTLEDAEIVYSSSNVAVCSNISYSESQVPNDSVFVL